MSELQTYILGIFRCLCLVEPSLEKGLQFAHVLKAQLESLKAANRRLAEHLTYMHTQTNQTSLSNKLRIVDCVPICLITADISTYLEFAFLYAP